MNKRVLVFWRIGDGRRYTYVSKIADDYKLPLDTKGVVFYEGIIVNDVSDLEDLIIKLPMVDQTLIHDNAYYFKSI